MEGESHVQLYKEQCEQQRHLERVSQRVLSVVIGIATITIVFARPGWVEFFVNMEPPVVGLTASTERGSVSNLTPTLVLNHGPALQVMVIMSALLLIGAGIWASRVLFTEGLLYFEVDRQWMAYNQEILNKSKKYLKISYIHLGLALLFLGLAAAALGAFYLIGGISVLIFSSVNVVLHVLLAIIISWKLSWGIDELDRRSMPERKDLISAGYWTPVALVIILYYGFVAVPSLRVLYLWFRLTGWI